MPHVGQGWRESIGGIAAFCQGAIGSQIGPGEIEPQTWEGVELPREGEETKRVVGEQFAYFVLRALEEGEIEETADLGVRSCSPPVPNTSSAPGILRAWGQASPSANDLRLVATGLPLGVFGFFLASETPGNVPNPKAKLLGSRAT